MGVVIVAPMPFVIRHSRSSLEQYTNKDSHDVFKDSGCCVYTHCRSHDIIKSSGCCVHTVGVMTSSKAVEVVEQWK